MILFLIPYSDFEPVPLWKDKAVAKERFNKIMKKMPQIQRRTHLKDELNVKKRLLVAVAVEQVKSQD